MSRNNLIEEAIADAQSVREAALENAKSMIIDAFTPQLKTKVKDQLEKGSLNEGKDQPGGYDGGHPDQSGEDMLNKGEGSAVYEDDETVEESDEVSEGDDIEEEVYEIALGEEGEGDWEEEAPEEEAPEEESPEEEAPEEDTMEYAYESKQVATYINTLREENTAYKKAVKQLQREFNEVNLFNAKLIYANKVLRTPGLTKNQKMGIVEQFDKAGTIPQVKLIFHSLTEGVKIGASVNRKKTHQSSSTVKSVSGKEQIINEKYQRMQELSGVIE